MKCDYATCSVTGVVPCDDCNGSGEAEGSIIDIELDKSSAHYNELLELQNDVGRIESDCERLIALKPAHEASYRRQATAALAEIEDQAETVMKAEANDE